MPNNKIQILIIPGGMTFKNRPDYLHFLKTREISIIPQKRWSQEYLNKKLGRQCEIIRPNMPLADNAKYNDWLINFKRYFPYLRPNIILIGSSLGGIFLAKYLSENKFPRKILAVYLIAPPFDDHLSSEDLVGGFKLKNNLSLIEKNCQHVNLLFSRHDDVVPVAQAKKYARHLKKSQIIIFNHIPGHFKIAEFPEIIKMIKNDIKKK